MRLDDAARDEIRRDGRDPDEVLRQLALLVGGARYTAVDRPCGRGDGILVLPERPVEARLERWRAAAREGRITSFVPASGAATRMVASLARLAAHPEPVRREDLGVVARAPGLGPAAAVLADPAALALWDGPAPTEADLRRVARAIVGRVATRPKALLPFHRYPDGSRRTALEEHLVEAAALCPGADPVRVHLTLDAAFHAEAARVAGALAARCGRRFAVAFSVQSPRTDTVALRDGALARSADGRVLYRPGGHGALLGNLEALGGDVVLIKNIDNILPERRREVVVAWRRRLVGVLLELEAEVHGALRALDRALPGAVERAARVAGGGGSDPAALRARLHRPIRVCAMVENRGEPGGGPFWVPRWGRQIVEASQIDRSDPEQVALLREATHFNPVDIACSLRDHRGEPYRLADFVDHEAVIVTDKVHRGRPLRVLEHPGLWNGAMAGWTTRFVEVPIALFQPAKTLADLLGDARRG